MLKFYYWASLVEHSKPLKAILHGMILQL